jgi:hypothetical protein
MPGSAIGSTKTSEITSRPKNEYRAMAAAANDPKIKAMMVAKVAVSTDNKIASLTPGLDAAFVHQVVVKPVGGQLKDLFLLNELITTNIKGT